MVLLLYFLLVVSQSKFFILSDLHYDIAFEPYYNKTYNCHSLKVNTIPLSPVPSFSVPQWIQPGCDSSFSFLFRTVSKMQEIDPNPEFILILGDDIAHYTISLIEDQQNYNVSYNSKLIQQSHKDISLLLSKSFPQTQIIHALGNNDAYAHNKMPKGLSKSEYFQFLYQLWSEKTSISSSFFLGGYYWTQTSSGYNILILNSVYYSVKTEENIQRDIQMIWLKENLSKLDKNIIIAMHIPPGVAMLKEGTPMWLEFYTKKFVEIIKLYRYKILAVFSGHLHSTGFQLIDDLPLIVNPSVSPIFENNPGFRYFDLENQNYEEFTFNAYDVTKGWKSFMFSETFEGSYLKVFEGISNDRRDFFKLLARATGWWVLDKYEDEELLKMFFGNLCNLDLQYCVRIAVCSIQYLSYYEYLSCLTKGAK